MGKFLQILPNLLVLFLLFGCAQSEIQIPQDQIIQDNHLIDNHLNCDKEKQLSGCALTEDNNAKLFGRDYLGIVEGLEIKTDTVSGFLAYPTKEGKYPGVIMIHEWWGLNENILEMAKLLASEGYVVFAVDLYGKVAKTPQEAQALMIAASSNQADLNYQMSGAATFLRNYPRSQGSKIGSIGWCFGGGQSLQLALSGEKLDGTIIYYGRVTDNSTMLSKIKWPVLGLFASEDKSITPESVRKFDSAIDGLGIENEILIYPRVGHAFANPSGASFAPNETIDAWARTLSFFEKNLK